jgi:hypothetical protein
VTFVNGGWFVVESYWIWIIIAVHTVLMIWFTERGDLVGASVALILAAGSLLGLSHVSFREIWDLCCAHAWGIPGIVGAYLVMGLAWAAFKWWEYVHAAREGYERQRAQWLLPRNLRRRAIELRELARYAVTPDERVGLLKRADACQRAAALGGCVMTEELKPLWREHLHDDGLMD